MGDNPPEKREVLILAVIDADQRRGRLRPRLRERLLVEREAECAKPVEFLLYGLGRHPDHHGARRVVTDTRRGIRRSLAT